MNKPLPYLLLYIVVNTYCILEFFFDEAIPLVYNPFYFAVLFNVVFIFVYMIIKKDILSKWSLFLYLSSLFCLFVVFLFVIAADNYGIPPEQIQTPWYESFLLVISILQLFMSHGIILYKMLLDVFKVESSTTKKLLIVGVFLLFSVLLARIFLF